jgi:lysyl-tRNA synthetase class 1
MRFALIDNAIAEFERRSTKFWPHEVAGALYALDTERQLPEVERRALDIEIAGWELRPNGEQRSKGGTYFHPLLLGNREDGSQIYHPNLAELGGEAISQWSERLQLVANPFLKARYADLLWDLAHIVQPSSKRDFKSGRAAVDAYTEQASALEQVSDIEAAMALERAFRVATELNDVARTDLVAGRLLLLGSRAPLGSIGVWSMPTRCLLDNRKVAGCRRDQLMAELERRLGEAAQAVNGYACEVAAGSLCKSYRHESDRAKRVRVLRTLADTYERQAAGANAGVAIHWLSSVVSLLEGEGLTEDADRLRLIVEQRGPEVLASMKTMSVETSIDRQELDESIERIIAVDHPFLALFKLARDLSPKCESLRLQVKEHEKEFIFYSLLPRTIIGHDGLPKATIGSSETDLEGRMVEEAMQAFPLTPNLFHLGYAKAKERFGFTPHDLVEVLSASYLCSPEISTSLAEGVQAYDAEDYTKTISVLIPQIEAMLRELLKILGVPIQKGKRRRSGFSELKNMNDVLTNRLVEDAMEEDLLFFLRIIFIDPRGLNLRNEFAHGALPANAFNRGTSSIVMMALLTLTMIGPHGFYLSSEAIEEERDSPITAEAVQDDLTAIAVEG